MKGRTLEYALEKESRQTLHETRHNPAKPAINPDIFPTIPT